jgi:hypothetical protein
MKVSFYVLCAGVFFSKKNFLQVQRSLYQFVGPSKVVFATRDCVCLEVRSKNHRGQLAFGFRGTALKRDLLVDA